MLAVESSMDSLSWISSLLFAGTSVYLGRALVNTIREKNDIALKLREAETNIQAMGKHSKDREDLIKSAELQLTSVFKALSAETLQSTNKHFLEMARVQFDQRTEAISDIVKPVRDSLEKVDLKILELEKTRIRADENLHQHVRALVDAQKDLRTETANLVTALRAPQARGMWGEMQLKRVVEMAGMLEHCDFYKQESVMTETGRLRPDMIVKLPGAKNIVVDAKTPLIAFLEAIQEQNPDAKKMKFAEHARHVRKHLEQLSKKSYWDQFQPAPEFVVLFLPSESFFSAALESDASLIEAGVSQNVIIATPTTLIALLRAVAFGWRQERLAENARAIGALGKELYKRLGDLTVHFGRVGKNLESAVDAYNSAVGTLESRVLVSGRKFRDLDSAGMPELPELPPLDRQPRALQADSLDKPSV